MGETAGRVLTAPHRAVAGGVRAGVEGIGGALGLDLDPDITRIQPESQASPLATDFIKFLQGQLAEGAFGTGVGPLQRQAGTAASQFVSSLSEAQATGGLDPGTKALIDAIRAETEVTTGREAGNLREAFGAAGSRFGTTLGKSEALLRSERGLDLDRLISETLVGQQQFNIGALLKGIQALQGIGQENIEPFLRLAELGILPEEIIASPGLGQQILAGLIQGGSSAAVAAAGGGG